MLDLIIGDRRQEVRRPGVALPADVDIQVPGVRVLEVLDVSARGVRCRLGSVVRPGRPMTLRLRAAGVLENMPCMVLRCQVFRITRHNVQYEAAWHLTRSWRAGN